MIENPKCLICKNNIKVVIDDSCIAGGTIRIDFGFGSKFDMGCDEVLIDHSTSDDRTNQLLNQCNMIKAYICDDCAEQNMHLFEGYKITRPDPAVELVVPQKMGE